ncbi:hypothetical protein IWW54_003938 [Coemansia sp. RSA 2705]|nr:hypothetical protein IWW54_003938 [Coemansia sp. RSA 2705]
MSSEVVENKRKRQESVHGNDVLLNENEATEAVASEPASPGAEDSADNNLVEQKKEEEGASPAKRPRTSEDGDENDEAEATETTEPAVSELSAAAPATNPVSAAPVFGRTFSGSRGLGGFASAAKGPSPFASFASAASSSGFARYASAPAKSPGIVAPAESTGSNAGDSSEAAADAKESQAGDGKDSKTFEDMLTAEGKESLATNAAMSAMVPAMAHALVSEAQMVPVRTHEEDETCEFAAKAKLFELVADSWKERGAGQFKLNRHNDDAARCRLVMRTDQTFRLILNAPLFVGMKLSCERRFVRLTCVDTENMKPVTFALRFASEALAADAFQHVSDAVPAADAPAATSKGKAAATAEDSAAEDSDGDSAARDCGEDGAARDSDEDSEEDEDYEESGSESDDNVLSSDARGTDSEAESDDADDAAAQGSSSKAA